MRGIVKFAITELKLVLKDKSFYFWAIVLPIIFVFIFSGLGKESVNKETKIPVYIKNLDSGRMAPELIKYLKGEKLLLFFENEKGKNLRTIIIPKDFSEKILSGEKSEIKFKVNGKKLDSSSIQIKIALYRAIYKFLISKNFGIKEPKEILSIKVEWAGRASYIPAGVIHQMPATILTFLLFNLLIFGGTNLVKLRERGMLKRLMITPLGKGGIWAGLFFTNIFVGFLVVFMIIISSVILFSVSFGAISLLNMLFILLIFSSFVSSLSIYIGSVLKRAEAVVGLSILFANLLAALGGCWWPIEIVPDFMKKIAMLLPTGWAMAGIDKILFYKYPFSSVILNIIVLLCFTVVFAFLSIKYFKVEKN